MDQCSTGVSSGNYRPQESIILIISSNSTCSSYPQINFEFQKSLVWDREILKNTICKYCILVPQNSFSGLHKKIIHFRFELTPCIHIGFVRWYHSVLSIDQIVSWGQTLNYFITYIQVFFIFTCRLYIHQAVFTFVFEVRFIIQLPSAFLLMVPKIKFAFIFSFCFSLINTY